MNEQAHDDAALPWRAQLLLRGPRALGVLARFCGLDLTALLKECLQAPAPETHLGISPHDVESLRHAVAGLSLPGNDTKPFADTTPRWLRQVRKRRYTTTWSSHRDRHSPSGPRYITDVDLADPDRVAAEALNAVDDWPWAPEAQAARPYLLVEADTFAPAARQLAAAPAAAWWWHPLPREHQVMLGSPDTPPKLPDWPHRAEPGEGDWFWWVPPIRMTTSTRAGPHLPAAQLYDPDLTAHIEQQPIGCWHLPIREDARVYEIHAPSDWLALCERYPRVAPTPGEWPHWGIAAPYALAPDWAAMADDWDRLHVSMAGLLTTGGLPLAHGPYVSLLERVGTEQTAWFRPCFGTPELITTIHDDGLPP